LCGPREIGDGAGEEIEIVEDCGRHEDESQRDAALAKLVGGVGGRDGVKRLLHGGNLVGIATHEAIGFAVDARDAGDGLGRAGPVSGVGVGEIVSVRPDAEVGVVRDEGRRWRALLSFELEDGER